MPCAGPRTTGLPGVRCLRREGGHISSQNVGFTLRPRDPAEAWEIVYSETEEIFPRNPRKAEEVPHGALESLSSLCGLHGLHQVFMIPWAIRSTGLGDQKVITPSSVLAVGDRAVALWTEKPEPGVKVVIHAEKLVAIEDVTVLLYGRLSFLPAGGGRLTIRYNTLARPGLTPSLLGLRRKIAGPARPLPAIDVQSEKLPFKWRHLFGSDLARLWKQAPAVFRFANAPRKSRTDIERGQLLVLNPHELVYMWDPFESIHRYGADSFIIPRSCITEARAQGETLEVTANGARLSLPMVTELGEAAARWFA